jgi:hypothetical protein
MRFYVAAKLQLHYLFFNGVLNFQVMPEWAHNKQEAFEVLAQRWLSEDEGFTAVSERNKANRGSGGTHNAGSRNTDCYKDNLVHYGKTCIYFLSCSYFLLHTHNISLTMQESLKFSLALPKYYTITLEFSPTYEK